MMLIVGVTLMIMPTKSEANSFTNGFQYHFVTSSDWWYVQYQVNYAGGFFYTDWNSGSQFFSYPLDRWFFGEVYSWNAGRFTDTVYVVR